MGLIKRIFGEVHHGIVDLSCGLFINAVGDTAGDILLRIAVDEIRPLFFHDGLLLFTHGTAHQVASAQSISRQVTDDLHYLLLVYDTAVGGFQDRLQLRTGIGHILRMVFPLDVLRDKIHRARTIQRNTGHYILQILGAQFLHEALHPGTFQLEHTFRSAGADGSQYFRVIIIYGIHINVSAGGILYEFYSIMDHGQGTQSQKVHFQQAQFFQRRHGELGNDGTVRASGQRHEFVCGFLTDHDTGRMHRGMSGQSLQSLTHIDQVVDLFVLLIELAEFRIHLQCSAQCNVQFVRHHFGNRIHERIGQVHDTAHIADDTFRRQSTEGDDLYHLVIAVFSAHIIDDLLSPFKAEIHVNIRHRDTFRIQESFKQQIVMNRIDVGDLQAICHDTSRRGASSRPHGDPVLLRIIDEIPHDQEVVHISHSLNNAKFVIKALPERLSGLSGGLITVAVAFCQSVIAELI